MQSPGHKQHPEHKVVEKHLDGRVKVELDGELLADSRDVIEVDEDGSPPRYYFPRGDVRMEKLARSPTTSQCPFKGTARYFGIRAHGKSLDDAVWSYEEPFDEHHALAGRVAFWSEKHPEIHIGAPE